jgi:hypothetical protein
VINLRLDFDLMHLRVVAHEIRLCVLRAGRRQESVPLWNCLRAPRLDNLMYAVGVRNNELLFPKRSQLHSLLLEIGRHCPMANVPYSAIAGVGRRDSERPQYCDQRTASSPQLHGRFRHSPIHTFGQKRPAEGLTDCGQARALRVCGMLVVPLKLVPEASVKPFALNT